MTDPATIDVSTRAWNAAIDHWPLVLFGAVAGWKGLPFLLRHHMPLVLKSFFENGGGIQLKALVREENEAQTRLHNEATAKMVAEAIAKHQVEEQKNLEDALSDLRMEITGEYPLMPNIKKRPKMEGRARRRRR